jgi:hypothetical protein
MTVSRLKRKAKVRDQCTSVPISFCRVVEMRCDDDRRGDDSEMVLAETGTDQENGVNRLPENATALEMRQWADRMLGRSAGQQEDGAGATVIRFYLCVLY